MPSSYDVIPASYWGYVRGIPWYPNVMVRHICVRADIETRIKCRNSICSHFIASFHKFLVFNTWAFVSNIPIYTETYASVFV